MFLCSEIASDVRRVSPRYCIWSKQYLYAIVQQIWFRGLPHCNVKLDVSIVYRHRHGTNPMKYSVSETLTIAMGR